MTQVTIAEAQRRLPELLSAAEAGETVRIQSEEGRTFTLTVATPRRSSILTGRATRTPVVPKG